MIWFCLAVLALAAASLPAVMFVRNLPLFQTINHPSMDVPAVGVSDASDVGVPNTSNRACSVLIPARDEANGIAASVSAALQSSDGGDRLNIEVVVLDDHSTDGTAEIVADLSATDPRVRLETSQPLPDGWNGKQFACRQLADLATHEVFVFLDADVRLHPSGLDRLLSYRESTQTALLSAFPRQITGTIAEQLIIPMMHYILLGFLPMDRMRQSPSPAYASGCGQLFMTDRESYRRAGTHETLASSRHDGVKLPRAYRQAGLMTDVVDGTDIASCRMYTNGGEVLRGVLKNATEGVANPRVIVPFSIILLSAALLPWITLVGAAATGSFVAAGLAGIAILVSYIPRVTAAIKLRQSKLGAILHPVATTIFVALQWVALFNAATGRSIAWRGRN